MKINDKVMMGWKKKYKAKDLFVCKIHTVNNDSTKEREGVSYWWSPYVMADWGEGFFGVCAKSKDKTYFHITTNNKLKLANPSDAKIGIGETLFLTSECGKLFREETPQKLANKKFEINDIFKFEEKLNTDAGLYASYTEASEVSNALSLKRFLNNNGKNKVMER